MSLRSTLSAQTADNVLAVLAKLRSEGLTILLTEQNIHAPLAAADHVYIHDCGLVIAEGSPRTLSTRDVTSAMTRI
jgi:branched-chain amino acid transport system ATP-binding protein